MSDMAAELPGVWIVDGERYPCWDLFVTSERVVDRVEDIGRVANFDEKVVRIYEFLTTVEPDFGADTHVEIIRYPSADCPEMKRYSFQPWGINYHGYEYSVHWRHSSDLVAVRLFDRTFAEKYTDEAREYLRSFFEDKPITLRPDIEPMLFWTYD